MRMAWKTRNDLMARSPAHDAASRSLTSELPVVFEAHADGTAPRIVARQTHSERLLKVLDLESRAPAKLLVSSLDVLLREFTEL